MSADHPENTGFVRGRVAGRNRDAIHLTRQQDPSTFGVETSQAATVAMQKRDGDSRNQTADRGSGKERPDAR